MTPLVWPEIEVDGARGGGAEGGAEGVVVEGVVLGVVPQAGDGVAVEVAHGEAGGVGDGGGAGAGGRLATAALSGGADGEREEVHLAAVEGRLLGAVGVVLVGGGRLAHVEAEGIGGRELYRCCRRSGRLLAGSDSDSR